MNFFQMVLFTLFFSSIIFSAQNPCKGIEKNKLDSISGYLDNDNSVDYLHYARDPSDREIIDITICTQDSFFSFKYNLSESSIHISNPERGIIEIAEGSFSGSAPIYYYYYTYNPNVTNWLLTKNISYEKNVSEDGIMPPTVQISYGEGITRIDGNPIPKKSAIVEQQVTRTMRFNATFDSLYTVLNTSYKNKELATFNDSKLSVYLIAEILKNVPITKNNLERMNDFAYFLSLTKNCVISSVYVLEEIIKKFPDRIVAYLNVADAYYDLKSNAIARKYYLQYRNIMTKAGKGQKIPSRAIERSK